jgi:hypothetical protein
MKYNRILPVFISLLLITSVLKGQILIGMQGGLNYSTLFKSPNFYNGEGFTSYLSYCSEIELKGRKPKPIHLGMSLMYSRDYFVFNSAGGGYFPYPTSITYSLNCLRITIFPEFSTGKKIQFFCNIGPYVNIMISSSKNGETWHYENFNNDSQEVYTYITGSANDTFKPIDVGIQESIGLSFIITSWFGLTFKENGSLGFLNVNKSLSDWNLKTESIRLLMGAIFIISKK